MFCPTFTLISVVTRRVVVMVMETLLSQHGGVGHPLTGAGDRTLARDDTASWAAVAGLMAAVLGPLTWLVMEAVRLALA